MQKNINTPPLQAPAISVVVPMYNVERYIKQCVDSILAQTFQDFEIIIIDDASPDNGYELCKKLYGNNEKIRIVRHKTNKGLGETRNTGIDNAKGKYIYFLDSDDWILPNALEILYNAAIENDADVVHSSYWYQIYEEDLQAGHLDKMLTYSDVKPIPGLLISDVKQRVLDNWFRGDTTVMVWLNLYKREFLIQNNLRFADMLSEDVTFSLLDIAFSKHYFKVPQSFYIRRKRQNSITTTSKSDLNHMNKYMQSFIVGVKYIGDNLKRLPTFADDKRLIEQIQFNYLNKCLINFANERYNIEGNINYDFDDALNNALELFFKENTFFVKYLLHNFSVMNVKNRYLKQEIQKFQKAIEHV